MLFRENIRHTGMELVQPTVWPLCASQDPITGQGPASLSSAIQSVPAPRMPPNEQVESGLGRNALGESDA
ncbi:hypothetical protein Sfulv_32460 [Streptomyces fulvorobeus]|uniref:Uncharacterized protein n=1 Tax=Streptomyces fulvorobeus TaxID=284028 RepID=A0A7J0C7D2_9ACTN|nr:hypothetical protein Sfulv_32460 [Streptomyces fulvorobeus]